MHFVRCGTSGFEAQSWTVGRLVLKNGLWLLSFLWLPPPLLSGPGALWYLERVYSHPVFHTSPSIYTETYVWLHSRLVPGCSVLLEEGGGRTLGLFSRRVLCTSLGVAPAGSKHSRGLNGLSSIRAVFGCNPPLGVESRKAYIRLHSRLCQDVVSTHKRVVGGLSW